MTLYELMRACAFNQIFHVYVTNIYDQNIIVGHGTRRDIADEETTEAGYDHLADKVEHLRVAQDGSLIVLLSDSHFNYRAEELYDAHYVSTWNIKRPETRPWRFSSEIERGKFE